MGIRSTQYISRDKAIERINHIHELINLKEWRTLEKECYEDDLQCNATLSYLYNLRDRLGRDYNKWTNKMLSDVMDLPYFRFSMFDNYVVEDKE